MKMLLISKKQLKCSLFMILIIIGIYVTYFAIKPHQIFAIELTHNSSISEEFRKKVQKLTEGEEKIAYLTFDDGPNPSTTPKILDILKSEDVKATFFVVGKHVKEYPNIMKRIYEEGHYIGNHGYNHNNDILYKSEESFMNEILKTDKEIGEAIGIQDYCSHIFRFPNGYMSSQNKGKKKKAATLLLNSNYTYIDWNCLNNDSVKRYTKEQLLSNLKRSSKNKNTLVILMHDTNYVSNSAIALEDSIKYLKSQGYRFENFYNLIE